MDRIAITDRISYIKASKDPLSADVILLEGEEYLYVFDVGNREEVAAFLNTLPKKKKVILSHFHPDHIGNMGKIEFECVYAAANTEKYFHQFVPEYESGKTPEKYRIVSEQVKLEDGVELEIWPVPSSHARGSLLLQADGIYIFLGDAVYSTRKGGKIVYNAQLLKEEIKLLQKLPGDTVFLSHDKRPVKGKNGVIRFLQKIYESREKDEPYISV